MSRLPQAPRTALVALAFALAIPLVVPLAPALAQTGAVAAAEAAADARVRKLEAEVRALQRSVFPGGDGKFFPAQVQAGQITTGTATAPATTPVTDMLARVDALEAQLARLTAQSEENSNKLKLLEMKVKALTPVPVTDPTGTTPVAAATTAASTTTTGNLAAMTSGASATKPAPTPAATAAAKPAPKPAVTAAPSAQRIAAVRAVEKPQTADVGEDEYSYGFRLWEAKFQPEAQQQLKLFLQKYPRHARRSYAHNLLGRSLLDEGKPREAGEWFLANYRDNKAGDRAPDSVLFLGEAMRQLKDTNRACIALAQFVDEYPREAAGRLKAQYDTTRAGVKCN